MHRDQRHRPGAQRRGHACRRRCAALAAQDLDADLRGDRRRRRLRRRHRGALAERERGVELVREAGAGPGPARNAGRRGAPADRCSPSPTPTACRAATGCGPGSRRSTSADLVQGVVVPDPAGAARPVRPHDLGAAASTASTRPRTCSSAGSCSSASAASSTRSRRGSGKPLGEDVWFGWRARRSGRPGRASARRRSSSTPSSTAPAREFLAERLRLAYFPLDGRPDARAARPLPLAPLVPEPPQRRLRRRGRRAGARARSAAALRRRRGALIVAPLAAAVPTRGSRSATRCGWRRRAPDALATGVLADLVGFLALIAGTVRAPARRCCRNRGMLRRQPGADRGDARRRRPGARRRRLGEPVGARRLGHRPDAVRDAGALRRPPTPPRSGSGAETWVERDICDREPWPFADDQFDFAVCSHTLEDVRDPVFVCAELNRVARAGYLEVPSRLEEQSWGVIGPYVGWSHHRWLVDVGADRRRVRRQAARDPRQPAISTSPPGSPTTLSAEERVEAAVLARRLRLSRADLPRAPPSSTPTSPSRSRATAPELAARLPRAGLRARLRAPARGRARCGSSPSATCTRRSASAATSSPGSPRSRSCARAATRSRVLTTDYGLDRGAEPPSPSRRCSASCAGTGAITRGRGSASASGSRSSAPTPRRCGATSPSCAPTWSPGGRWAGCR